MSTEGCPSRASVSTTGPAASARSPEKPAAQPMRSGAVAIVRASGRIPNAGRRRLDARHHLGGELRRDVDRLEVLLDLRDARGARDDRRDVRVLQAPREGELRERAAEL